ncbi:MAG TPA: sigma-54-dependent Fis family transcriptional regulator [Firmicutes bacterium]|nr:sigma-54-dependent Fis family transcriptional regulator [Bacillota bacterium]
MSRKILVIDDEKKMLRVIELALLEEKYEVFTSDSVRAAKEKIIDTDIDLIISDLKMPEESGLDLLKWLKNNEYEIPVIMITAFATVDTAVESMKLGAVDYIIKPFKLIELKEAVSRYLYSVKDPAPEPVNILMRKRPRHGFREFIGSSGAMVKVRELAKKAAKTMANVLITGETGTGKEILAEYIHRLSDRRDKALIKVNCTSIPYELIESELFGHVKGAYTHAYTDKEGKFEIADGGSIFLDEIGSMRSDAQAKILRVIQDKEFQRVGGVKNVKVDVRIISATNEDLTKAIKAGKFREDLFYRLKVIQIEIPPLREHKSDITELTRFFIEKFKVSYGLKDINITAEATDKLNTYDWFGNIRELENVIEQAVILSEGGILAPDDIIITRTSREDDSGYFGIPDSGINLEELEYKLLIQALKKANNNQTKAAQLLGISRSALRYRMEKHDIPFK